VNSHHLLIADSWTSSSLHWTMLVRMSLALLVVALVVVTAGSLRDGDAAVSALEAEATASRWVGVGVAESPRREGEEWEVDVVRPDGSLVEVTIGDQLELQALDEELGPGRRPAHDEVTGPVRERAVRAALAATGPGRVLSVERDSSRELEVTEVNVRHADGVDVEVGLDSGLRVVEVESQDPGDE
jgi:hypothetical protein